MKYSIVTFGCRVNQADSLGFEEELLASGASASSPDQADLVVVNTCSVTAAADQGARQTIRRVARDNPAARIVVTGCYATRAPGDVAPLPQVARVVPNTRKDDLVREVARDWHLTTAERFGGGRELRARPGDDAVGHVGGLAHPTAQRGESGLAHDVHQLDRHAVRGPEPKGTPGRQVRVAREVRRDEDPRRRCVHREALRRQPREGVHDAPENLIHCK